MLGDAKKNSSRPGSITSGSSEEVEGKEKEVSTRPGAYAMTPLNTSDIAQAILNIEAKSRSNPLPWNGQFSPQLIQSLLEHYASQDSIVLDPFVGSGTVILEAGRAGLKAYGAEINPAALILARTYSFINASTTARQSCVSELTHMMRAELNENLLLLSNGHAVDEHQIKESLVSLASEANDDLHRYLLEALIILLDFYEPGLDREKVWRVWHRLTSLVLTLPVSTPSIELFHADARNIPLPNSSVNLVITSPPYINVFNYHQQYRASAEALGWNLLNVAKSEIGSNRKHRSNRFLTVIQFCLDIAQTFVELARICQPQSKIVFVAGRESRVRGTRFFNGEIVAEVACRAVGFHLVLRQERVFVNKFGQSIFEDILHFASPPHPNAHPLVSAREIAHELLALAYETAPGSSRPDIKSALADLRHVHPSPTFKPIAHQNYSTRSVQSATTTNTAW